MTARYIVADVFDGLATLEDGSVDLVITSPPFLALRSYLPSDHPDKGKEIGSESTPAEFLDVMLRVTAELRRVLAPHGSICVELGDTYAGSGGGGGDYYEGGLREGQPGFTGSADADRDALREANAAHWRQKNQGRLATYSDDRGNPDGMRDTTFSGANTRTGGGHGWPLAKSKTLIPEMYRIALAYGINPLTGTESPAGRWRVRNVVTWCRPNPPVGALGDKWRPATSDVVVACVSDKRYWDDIATRRPFAEATLERSKPGAAKRVLRTDGNEHVAIEQVMTHAGAPLLDYWEIPPGGYPGSHYAVFPPALVEPLVKAMAPPKVCRQCGEPSRRIAHGSSASARLIPDAIASGREVKNLSRQDLASSLGVGANNVWDWEVGGHQPPFEVWQRIKGILDLVDDLDDAFPPDDAYEQVPLDRERPTKAPVAPGEVNPAGRLGGFAYNRTVKTPREFGFTDCGHDDWRPALILDPFAGSGTTLSVATGHGHEALGIDLDERNRDLALDRIGPLLWEEVPT